MWNLLDYPSTVIPVANFKIGGKLDPPNRAYKPLTSNPYDKPNHEMCAYSLINPSALRPPNNLFLLSHVRSNLRSSFVDDPKLFENQPSCIQIVGRPFDDEELIEVSAAVDKVLREAGSRRGEERGVKL